MERPELRASIDDANETQRHKLITWRDHVQGISPGSVGLWVFGPRSAGTSHLAEVAVHRFTRDHPDVTWEHIEALHLTSLVRDEWSYGEQIRQHADDYSLWLEYRDIDDRLFRIWNGGMTWIDDFHHEVTDLKFWRKHIQPHLESRVKNGLPTVVSTTMAPSFVEFQGVIERLFVTVFCDAGR